jgi:hypothetical protein
MVVESLGAAETDVSAAIDGSPGAEDVVVSAGVVETDVES